MKIRSAVEDDLSAIVSIEQANFSKEEAATPEAMKERLEVMADTFLVAEDDGVVAGYVEGPVMDQAYITDDLFHHVTPNQAKGGVLAITSLSISPDYKGRGLGTMLLAAVKDLAVAGEREAISLTCHEELIPFYEMNGFKDMGKSESTHGGSTWYNMIWKNENVQSFITKM